MRKRSVLHPESLLNVPLVSQMLGDSQVRLVERVVDKRWFDKKVFPVSVVGFNPFRAEVYYGSESRFAAWIKSPERSAREHNESDVLMREVLFAVHDYLHGWACLAIRDLRPSLGFGTARITAKNSEDFVFCHLLTEAVATIGLDYWFLSTVDLNQLCDIGTAVRGLTASYREATLAEYRRFNREFEVQSPAFFRQMARSYCDGVFDGFDIEDLKQSPLLMRWLEHELRYGENQRHYIRLWLSFLGARSLDIAASKLDAPVRVSEPWQHRLMGELGEMLWEKVKSGKVHRFRHRCDPAKTWKSSESAKPDFRFVNANQVDIDELIRREKEGFEPSEQSFCYWFYQYVSRYDYGGFDPELTELFGPLIEKRSFALVHALFRDKMLLDARDVGGEPRDLLVLN